MPSKLTRQMLCLTTQCSQSPRSCTRRSRHVPGKGRACEQNGGWGSPTKGMVSGRVWVALLLEAPGLSVPTHCMCTEHLADSQQKVLAVRSLLPATWTAAGCVRVAQASTRLCVTVPSGVGMAEGPCMTIANTANVDGRAAAMWLKICVRCEAVQAVHLHQMPAQTQSTGPSGWRQQGTSSAPPAARTAPRWRPVRGSASALPGSCHWAQHGSCNKTAALSLPGHAALLQDATSSGPANCSNQRLAYALDRPVLLPILLLLPLPATSTKRRALLEAWPH